MNISNHFSKFFDKVASRVGKHIDKIADDIFDPSFGKKKLYNTPGRERMNRRKNKK